MIAECFQGLDELLLPHATHFDQQAATLIESTIDLPSQFESVPRAIANAQLLRVAVAMRDEPLTRKIMKHIAGDAGELSGSVAVNVFATVAAHTKAWPDAAEYVY